MVIYYMICSTGCQQYLADDFILIKYLPHKTGKCSTKCKQLTRKQLFKTTGETGNRYDWL